MIAGGVAYGEANPGAIAVANQQGADLVIVADTVSTVAEFIWAVKKDSPVKSLADFKGRKIGYTNPRSTSQALAILLLQKVNLKESDAELVKTGGFGEGVAALDAGLIDIAPLAEPVWSKFKDRFRGVVAQPTSATVPTPAPAAPNDTSNTEGCASVDTADRRGRRKSTADATYRGSRCLAAPVRSAWASQPDSSGRTSRTADVSKATPRGSGRSSRAGSWRRPCTTARRCGFRRWRESRRASGA